VATMRPVGILLLALTPLISCRLPIGIRYPRELSDAQMYIAWLAETKRGSGGLPPTKAAPDGPPAPYPTLRSNGRGDHHLLVTHRRHISSPQPPLSMLGVSQEGSRTRKTLRWLCSGSCEASRASARSCATPNGSSGTCSWESWASTLGVISSLHQSRILITLMTLYSSGPLGPETSLVPDSTHSNQHYMLWLWIKMLLKARNLYVRVLLRPLDVGGPIFRPP
jgi:hypothetical protein